MWFVASLLLLSHPVAGCCEHPRQGVVGAPAAAARGFNAFPSLASNAVRVMSCCVMVHDVYITENFSPCTAAVKFGCINHLS